MAVGLMILGGAVVLALLSIAGLIMRLNDFEALHKQQVLELWDALPPIVASLPPEPRDQADIDLENEFEKTMVTGFAELARDQCDGTVFLCPACGEAMLHSQLTRSRRHHNECQRFGAEEVA